MYWLDARGRVRKTRIDIYRGATILGCVRISPSRGSASDAKAPASSEIGAKADELMERKLREKHPLYAAVVAKPAASARRDGGKRRGRMRSSKTGHFWSVDQDALGFKRCLWCNAMLAQDGIEGPKACRGDPSRPRPRPSR